MNKRAYEDEAQCDSNLSPSPLLKHYPLIMNAAAIGVTEKEDAEQGIDEQDIFCRMVLFLAPIALFLFNRILGADDAPLSPVMGKSRYAESAPEGWPRVPGKMRKSFQEP
jgi:hypothetical protein